MTAENILSTVVSCSTIVYTVITLFQLRESKKVRLQKETPLIIPYLQSSENHLVMSLCIKNFGEGVAKDVKVKIKDHDFFGLNEKKLSTVGIVENGMNYFVPNFEFTFHLDTIVALKDKRENEVIEMNVSYTSLDNRSFNQTFTLAFNQMFGQFYSNPPETYMGQIPYHLKEITKQLKDVVEVQKRNGKSDNL